MRAACTPTTASSWPDQLLQEGSASPADVYLTENSPELVNWLTGLKRNAQLYQSDESVVAAVNRGDVATGIINHYYWYRLRLELGAHAMHSAVYFFPNHDVGSIENISGAGVLATSKHPQDAQRFVNSRPGVSPNPQLTALTVIKPATLGANALGNDQPASQLIQESGLA